MAVDRYAHKRPVQSTAELAWLPVRPRIRRAERAARKPQQSTQPPKGSFTPSMRSGERSSLAQRSNRRRS